ncbi:MAG: squalene--hopene cyclase [Mariniblastus sp.]|nr:squalene--hopene cyclase [Mariniblastus sp.]
MPNPKETETGTTLQRLRSAYRQAKQLLLDERVEQGHWVGELSGSALSTATAISALSYGVATGQWDQATVSEAKRQVECGLAWLVESQNEDGGWGDTELSYSNISTSMLVVAAIGSAGDPEGHRAVLDRARHYIDGQGGVEAIRRRYGQDKTFAVPILANCAMAGLVEWNEVAPLPFEAACVPQRFYHLMRMPVVSYAVPALVAIGQVKFHFDPPRNPLVRWIRKWSVGRSLAVLERMQPASGGFLEAVPLTSFVCMALIQSGRGDHPVVRQGIRFLLDSYRPLGTSPAGAGQGCWPIDTNLATWTTTLSVNALGECSGETEWNDPSLTACLDWIRQCQYQHTHPFTGAAPGGWGWSDLSGAVPDADDTPGALLALRTFYERADLNDQQRSQIREAVNGGVSWLLDLQNRDGGWPTFCRGWGRFPFDRSGCDITAHVLRSLLAWQAEIEAERRFQGYFRSLDRGFRYLDNGQEADGSWLPLWFGNQDYEDDVNPCYGTAKVLMAYRDADLLDTKSAENGLRWLAGNQNPDGGWGGGRSRQRAAGDRLGISSVEETALAVEALFDATSEEHRAAARQGVDWLVQAVESEQVAEPWPIGFYFAKLWYYEKLYPLIFSVSALGRVLNHDAEAVKE